MILEVKKKKSLVAQGWDESIMEEMEFKLELKNS